MAGMAAWPFVVETRIARVPVRAHWSILLAWPFAWAFAREVLAGTILFSGFVALLLAHEFGHALLARKLGLKVFSIEIYPFHGVCKFEEPYWAVQHYLVSWGGIAVQAVL